jgi:putative membrane protein
MNTNPMKTSFPLKSRFSRTCALGLAGALLPTLALSQTSVRDERVAPPARDVRVVETTRPLSRGDRDFMEKAAKASMSEVAISRVAAARTSNPDVRRFAQMMIEDHDSAVTQLSKLASSRGFSLPAKDPHPDKWEKRDAKDFDREYLEQMIDDHENVVDLFEKQAKDGEDVETVAYARKYLPKLQAHLQQALDLKRALSAKGDPR